MIPANKQVIKLHEASILPAVAASPALISQHWPFHTPHFPDISDQALAESQ